MSSAAATGTVDPRLVRWERNTRWLIILAALVPILGALGVRGSFHIGQLIIDSVAWTIFTVDLVVHLRLRRGYLRTPAGWIDLGVVLVTFPWYIIPAFGGSELATLARLARLARLLVLVVRGNLIKLLVRLGKTAVFAITLIVSCAIVAERVEPPGSGFDSFGDSLWWAVVTITTVGYGDLVPESTQGRIAGVVLMVGGLAVLGTIAAVTASFIRGEDVELDTEAGTGVVAATEDQQRVLRQVLAKIDEVGGRVETALAQPDTTRDD